jgi:hypothetical protein
MATFDVPPIGLNIKPPQQTSLADMLGIARGAQQYQQAQQINPLELQAKQQSTRTGEIQLGVVEQANKERLLQMKFLQDPKNWQDDNGNVSIPKLNEASYLFPQTFAEFSSKLTTLGTAQTEGSKAKQNLTQDKKALISSFLGAAGRFGVDDPAVVNKELQNFLATNPNDQEMKNLVEKAYVPIFSQMQKGPQVTDALIKASQAIMSPTQQQTTFAPTITTTAEGKTITTTPGAGITPPTSTIGMAGGLQANVSTGGPSAGGLPTAGAEVAPGMRLPFPVRRADQPYIAEPTEQKDQTAGTDYRNNLVNGQMTLAESRRNVSEVMQTASGIGENLLFPSGGVLGKLEQKALTAMKSSEYEMLAKDLARMAMDTSKAMGSVGGTVAGLDMSAVANGTVKVPPEVLIKIARRVDAGFTNLDLQANGAQQFSQKFGDNNMKAYQQAWNANAKDTRIFEAMNIMENETDPNKMKKDFEALFPSEKKRKTILKQYRNLKSLAATGVIAEPLTPEDF